MHDNPENRIIMECGIIVSHVIWIFRFGKTRDAKKRHSQISEELDIEEQKPEASVQFEEKTDVTSTVSSS